MPGSGTSPVTSSASRTVATPSANCSGITTTIHGTKDASALGSCATYTGHVNFATDLPAGSDIQLDGIQEITGHLEVEDVPGLISLSAPNLTSIGVFFTVQNTSNLRSLSFPSLKSVPVAIDLEFLPQLNNISFPNVLNVNEVTLTNTSITKLDQWSLNLASVGYLELFNNSQLTSVSFPLANEVVDTTYAGVYVSGNENLKLLELSNLTWSGEMELSNVAHISLPALKLAAISIKVDGEALESFQANALTKIGQNLTFTNMAGLHDLQMNSLGFVLDSITIDGAQNLTTLSLPRLQGVGGEFDLQGAISDLRLDDLANVQRGFNVNSSLDLSTSCQHFGKLKASKSVLKGDFTCTYPGASNFTYFDENTGLKTSAKIGIAVGVVLAGIILCGLATWLFRRRLRRKSSPEERVAKLERALENARLELSQEQGMFELGRSSSKKFIGIENRHELPGCEKMPLELMGDHAAEMHQREKFSFEVGERKIDTT